MDNLIHKILTNIKFRFINEMQSGKFDPSEGSAAPTFFQAADIANTHIDDSEFELLQKEDILKGKRGITIAMSYVINSLVKSMPEDQIYLNIGVWYGFSYFSGLVGNSKKICIGVDHFSEFFQNTGKQEFYELYGKYKTDKSEFHEVDFHKFFEKFDKKIGVYFYDAEHSYQNHVDGLMLAEPFFQVGTYILIDDSDRPEVYKSIVDFLGMNQNYLKYEIVLDKKTANPFHPTWHCGLIILKKVR